MSLGSLFDLGGLAALPLEATRPFILEDEGPRTTPDPSITTDKEVGAHGHALLRPLSWHRPAIDKPPAAWMTSRFWKLPLNWEELIGEVRWAGGGKFSVEVEAPESLAVVAEFIEQGDQNRRIVHLLNYAAPQGSAFSNVRVDAEWPKGKQVRQVTLLSPDGGEAAIVPSSVENGRVRFTVPRLQTYTMAIIQME